MRTSARIQARKAVEAEKNAAATEEGRIEKEEWKRVNEQQQEPTAKGQKRKARANGVNATNKKKDKGIKVAEALDMQLTNFHKLPSEVLLNVAARVEVMNVHNLSVSCSSLHALLGEEFWRDLAHVIMESPEMPQGMTARAYVLSKICVLCGQDIDSAEGCSLCSKQRISVTHAKSQFSLNDNDLSRFGFLCVENPHYANAAPMRLYRVEDVQLAYRRKHRMPYEAFLERKKEKRRLAAERKQIKMTSRTEMLEDALAAKGLELRDDSQRCDDFIRGSNKLSLEEVVDVMMDMHLGHIHGRLSSMQDSAYEGLIASLDGERLPKYLFDEEWSDAKDNALDQSLQNVRDMEEEYNSHKAVYGEVELCACQHPKFNKEMQKKLREAIRKQVSESRDKARATQSGAKSNGIVLGTSVAPTGPLKLGATSTNAV